MNDATRKILKRKLEQVTKICKEQEVSMLVVFADEQGEGVDFLSNKGGDSSVIATAVRAALEGNNNTQNGLILALLDELVGLMKVNYLNDLSNEN